MSGTVIVKLSRPAQAHGEEIKELRLREPNGDDFWNGGLPLSFSQGGATSVSMPDLLAMAARLAGVPPSTIRSLPSGDIMTLTQAMLPFFQPTGEVQSPEPSISPGSGVVTPLPSSRSA